MHHHDQSNNQRCCLFYVCVAAHRSQTFSAIVHLTLGAKLGGVSEMDPPN
jgi:hypothetical protein